MLRRLKGRVGVTGRLSPHSLRHTFARSYLVNGGDVFSLQRILGPTSLDMVKRYVALVDVDLVTRHTLASPADRLTGGGRRDSPRPWTNTPASDTRRPVMTHGPTRGRTGLRVRTEGGDELRSTLSPISVAGYVRTLKVLGNWLAIEELALAAALRTLRKPRVPDKLIEPVGDDAMRRLLAAAGSRDRAILLLLLDTGLRVSEAAGLRLGDMRADGTLKVRGKGAKERIVPVGRTARAAIVRYLGKRGAGRLDEALFLGRRGPLDARGIQQVVRRLKTRIGVSGRLSPHSLRHTFARSYLVNGGDVFSLQRILGHTTLDMVKRYVALADVDLVERHRGASPADRLAAAKVRHSTWV
jgi:site-specific recombinase XerD